MASEFFADFVGDAEEEQEEEEVVEENVDLLGDSEMSRSLQTRSGAAPAADITGLGFDSDEEDIDDKVSDIIDEPNCPSAWNSFLPITFIPTAKKTGAGKSVCTV